MTSIIYYDSQLLVETATHVYRCRSTVLPSQAGNRIDLAQHRWRAHVYSNLLQCTHRISRLANPRDTFNNTLVRL